MGKSIAIPKELIESPIWDNGKPYSEGQAYIQFIIWAESMGDDTHFINGNMVTLKHNEFIMSQRKMAEELGFSLGKLNYCLKALKTKGFVKIKNFQNQKNKIKYNKYFFIYQILIVVQQDYCLLIHYQKLYDH